MDVKSHTINTFCRLATWSIGLSACVANNPSQQDHAADPNPQSDTSPGTDVTSDTHIHRDSTVDTGPASPFPRWPRPFTEIGESSLCTQADPCLTEWTTHVGGVNIDNTIACTAGGYDGPHDTSTVCLFDYYHASGRRGDVVRFDPVNGTWIDLGSFQDIGLLSPTQPNMLSRWANFIDIDGDGQQELFALFGPTPLYRKMGDQWTVDLPFAEAMSSSLTDFPGVVDLNGDGRLDVLMYANSLLRSYYQQADGSWVEHVGATRFPGALSNAYDWLYSRSEDGTLTLYSLGSRLGSYPSTEVTGVFEQTGVNKEGYALFEEVYFIPLDEPMGGHLLDLNASGEPIVLAAGSASYMCPSVAMYTMHTWFDASQTTVQTLTGDVCGTPTEPTMSYLPWHIAPVDNQLLLIPTGDDARRSNGECLNNPICPEFQPLVGIWPNRDQEHLIALDENQMTFRAPDGTDQRMGNRRWAKCVDIDQDGDADCAISGVYYGRPQMMRNDVEGTRTCFRIIGTAANVPHHGGLARIQLEADERTWFEWPNASLSSGNEVCVILDGPLLVTINWPDSTVSTHSWAPGDSTNWLAIQP